ncbi:hypothetical protein [Taibaiella soli]|uniref:Uncharacterized protein n=1 Tax=Taibaiella soli TaxID=1649169 RepID=A0A2W2AFH5_9BACT|nr:hypothetical protein [Taibaiella soli]PZF74245.1 hypothetical protein DN068_04315 [Taibaiella soli]
MNTAVPENKQQIIINVLSNAKLSTDDEIIFYLQSKTKIHKDLITQIVVNERPMFLENDQHKIDFSKYF